MITLVICQPKRLVREAWIRFFSTHGISVVGDTDNYYHCVELIRSLSPKFVLITCDCIKLADLKDIRACNGGQSYLILICTNNPSAIIDYLHRTGTRGVLSLNSSIDEMYIALTKANAGKFYVSNSFGSEGQKRDRFATSLSRLTNKEWEVLHLLLDGKTSREIATSTCLSQKTVEVHRYNILKKLGYHKTIPLLNRLKNAFK